MKKAVIETNFKNLPLLKKGKVRDIYDLGDSLLIVATDRMSAFDVIMPDAVPDKGKILTQISLYWFDIMKPVIANHIISSVVEDYPEICRPYADTLRGRSMRVKKAAPVLIECVVRGYLSGSGWISYQQSGAVCGIKLPEGLRESDKLPEPIFTPSTKEAVGEHDVNIDFETAVEIIGSDLAEQLKALSIDIYKKGAELLEQKGIILADTKFEFGIVDNQLILIDEVLTPDSSRFWPRDSYAPGRSQQSFDKQYLRDYLLSIKWNKQPPAPNLPEDVLKNTRQKYMDVLKMLTGSDDEI
ncbi:MAG: phosphoribosylaminoimidazolesuccinocarboxamide synthase [Desulfobacterales bacterium]|nr:phosphoribosylaminoimidazolesuccinocarboxamide synthase [Desulfobacterales bacterium]MDD4073497.1 phosphoribosylaminoimidazolesuccinocarboxamide synthase [Desulfobacterales bacterium]MDD4393050.1 phosphoribosylaminoimidazolesuccinocarboxamide synthase [Desulfobacterales bacterium]